ncbi:MAG: alpha/beta hydrolase [Chloroflexota bacterium]|nr:alpha/beta hydrolase [Chloroflexota bacterium]
MVDPLRTTGVRSFPIEGGRIEVFEIPGGPGVPLLVLGGVELGLRPLAGTEQVLGNRWRRRAERRSIIVVGRPLPDDPADASLLLHPRAAADALGLALDGAGLAGRPLAVEAESGGGRISLWLALDRPELVGRLVLASVAAETPPKSPMAQRLARWIVLAETQDWGRLFAGFALEMRPAGVEGSDAFAAAAGLQPRPSTPERFIAELKATLDPSSFVTDRLPEIRVPTLVLAGGKDQVVPPDQSRRVAELIPGARFEIDPECGHTVRSSFGGYDDLVETFLAQGDRA